MFENYFSIFPWDTLPPNSVGFDLGCGSGRWARRVAPRVGTLHLIDPSEAIGVALDLPRKRLAWTNLEGDVGLANIDGSDARIVLKGQGMLTGICWA